MTCYRCTTENAEGRRYCRECGSPIVHPCQKCGFANSFADKFCGGCGLSLASSGQPPVAQEAVSLPATAVAPGGYSPEDLKELLASSSQGRERREKSEMKATDRVSQDQLDNLFDSEK